MAVGGHGAANLRKGREEEALEGQAGGCSNLNAQHATAAGRAGVQVRVLTVWSVHQELQWQTRGAGEAGGLIEGSSTRAGWACPCPAPSWHFRTSSPGPCLAMPLPHNAGSTQPAGCLPQR